MKLAKAGCMVFIENNMILTIERGNNPDNIGLIAGKAEAGEDYEVAAIREALEEAGLVVTECVPVYGKRVNNHFSMTFVATQYTGIIRDSLEGHIVWRKPQDLIRGEFAVYNKILIEHLIKDGWLK